MPKKRVKIDCYACNRGWITQGRGGRPKTRGGKGGEPTKRKCPICGGPPGKRTVWQ